MVSEIVFPTEPEPQCRRGFHVQEFIRPALNRGYALSEIEANPYIEVDDKRVEINSFHELTDFMLHFIGVVIGMKADGQCHAVAWDRKVFYEVDGKRYEHIDMTLHAFIAFVKIESNLWKLFS